MQYNGGRGLVPDWLDCENFVQLTQTDVNFLLNSTKKNKYLRWLFNGSWTLKWAFLITCRPSSVCPSFCKLFFSRTTGSTPTKLGTKHSWVKGIQVCSNEGPHPSQRGDDREIVKIHVCTLRTFKKTKVCPDRESNSVLPHARRTLYHYANVAGVAR